MATTEPTPSGSGTIQRHEQPFLFIWNRRLRHLHGVLLRNVHTSAATPQARGKTTTDDDAPYNLETPTKRALKKESHGLSHSRSFSNLTAAAAAATTTTTTAPTSAITSTTSPFKGDAAPTPRTPATASRLEASSPPVHGTPGLRGRRNTLQWHATSARSTRPQKAEGVGAHGLPDTWFSLHSKNEHVKEPIYVSEVMEKSINPSFAFFDLEHTASAVARADDCIVRVWAREADAEPGDWTLLLEVDVNLRSLQYLGRNLDNFHHPLPPNCLLFQLSDGVYTSFTDLPGDTRNQLRQPEHKAGPTEPSSSFDALMQLANLDDCIQDALKVRTQLEEEVNELLLESHAQRAQLRTLAGEKEQHANVYNAVQALKKQTSQLRRRKDELSTALASRREASRAGNADADSQLKQTQLLNDQIRERKQAQTKLLDQSSGQLRRIGEDLLTIFPIEPLNNKPLHFTIRKLYLPNSDFDDTNRDTVGAALGFTAQLVHLLSLYLAAPLPYPLEASEGNSFVHDPISIGLAQRKYPLYPNSVVYKFEYAVFLLNKDIEFLMSRVNLRALDIRHTLPNLKYLLYILTAGSGELPARKAGGIRGLLSDRGHHLSCQGSPDSARAAKESQAKANLKEPERNGSAI